MDDNLIPATTTASPDDEQECPPVFCFLTCAEGYAREDGCPVCRCAEDVSSGEDRSGDGEVEDSGDGSGEVQNIGNALQYYIFSTLNVLIVINA